MTAASAENMNYKDLRIVFLGTPDFAVATLQYMVEAGCNIVGVITAPDKPAGRGLKLTESAVKKYAVEKDLKILQPVKLKSEEFLQELKMLKADIQVVVAFRMLPELVWNMPRLGTINVHASLLPQYRGAAPINWAIINGEKETGITTFRLRHEIDTGDILLQEKIKISEKETAGDLHDRMKEIGANLLLETLKTLSEGNLHPISQSQLQDGVVTEIKHAPKIFTDTCEIHWSLPSRRIYDLVRGLSPFPTAFSFMAEKQIKIFRCEIEYRNDPVRPGEFFTDKKTYLKFAASDGYIHILELQMEGKKRMMIEDFLRGYRFDQ